MPDGKLRNIKGTVTSLSTSVNFEKRFVHSRQKNYQEYDSSYRTNQEASETLRDHLHAKEGTRNPIKYLVVIVMFWFFSLPRIHMLKKTF